MRPVSAVIVRWWVVIALLLAFVPIHGPAAAQPVTVDRVVAELEPEIRRMMVEGRVPSATIALVAGDRILWANGYGYSNLCAQTPATPNTVYLIGSTFKAMNTVALLQLVEQGLLGLDDRVGDLLPELRIRGESADRPVTVRHLLTHTSGLPVTFGPHAVWGETAPLPMERYLADSLSVVSAPMDSVRYSNIAYTLTAYLVQQLSGTEFREYVRRNVWEPLEMRSTTFNPSPALEERLAIPYALDEDGRHVPAVRLKANVWPAGLVYGTVLDQANWLIANLNGGVFEERRVVDERWLQQMHTLQFPEFAEPSDDFGGAVAGFGLTWRVTQRRGEHLFAHTGSVAGYTAMVMGNLDRRIGVAILTNGHRAHPHLYRLADQALEILKANH